VAAGGIVFIDGYGLWPGCRQGVDEFIQKRQLAIRMQRVDETAGWFQKS
jgi:hypothetical protein